MAQVAGAALQAIGHYWGMQPEMAARAYAAAAVAHVIPNYAPTFDQAKEWLERDTETVNDNTVECIDSLVSNTPPPFITIKHDPISSASGTATYVKKQSSTQVRKPSKAVVGSKAVTEEVPSTQQKPASPREPSEKKTPASAIKSSITSTSDSEPSTASAGVPTVSSRAWRERLFGVKSEEVSTSPVTSTADIETSTSEEVAPVSSASTASRWFDRFRTTSTSEIIAEITSKAEIEAGISSETTATATSSVGWFDRFCAQSTTESITEITSNPEIEASTPSELAPDVSITTASGWLDRFRAKSTEESTSEPTAEVTSAVEVEAPAPTDVAPTTSTTTASGWLNRSRAKSTEQSTRQSTQQSTSKPITEPTPEIAPSVEVEVPTSTPNILHQWMSSAREAKSSSEASNTVTTASHIKAPTSFEVATASSTKPFLGPILGWLAAKFEERAIRESHERKFYLPNGDTDDHDVTSMRSDPLLLLFAMLTFIPLMLLGLHGALAGHPRAQHILSNSTGIAYALVVVLLSYFESPWLICKIWLDDAYDWFLYLAWRVVLFLPSFQDTFLALLHWFQRSNEVFLDRACWAVFVGLALSAYSLAHAATSEPCACPRAHLNRHSHPLFRNISPVTLMEIVLLSCVAVLCVIAGSSYVSEIVIVFGTHMIVQFGCWVYIHNNWVEDAYHALVYFIYLCGFYVYVQAGRAFWRTWKWLSLYAIIALARPVVRRYVLPAFMRLYACYTGYMADAKVPASHQTLILFVTVFYLCLIGIKLCKIVPVTLVRFVRWVSQSGWFNQLRFVWRTATGNHPLRRIRPNLLPFIGILLLAPFIVGREALVWAARVLSLIFGRLAALCQNILHLLCILILASFHGIRFALVWLLKIAIAFFGLLQDLFGPLGSAILALGLVWAWMYYTIPLWQTLLTWIYQTSAKTVGGSALRTAAKISVETCALNVWTWITVVWDEFVFPVLVFVKDTVILVPVAIYTGFHHIFWKVMRPAFYGFWNALGYVYEHWVFPATMQLGLYCRDHWCEGLHTRWLFRLPVLVALTAFVAIDCVKAYRTYPSHKVRSLINHLLNFAVPYAISSFKRIGALKCTQDYIIIICTLLLFLLCGAPTKYVRAVAADDDAPNAPGGAHAPMSPERSDQDETDKEQSTGGQASPATEPHSVLGMPYFVTATQDWWAKLQADSKAQIAKEKEEAKKKEADEKEATLNSVGHLNHPPPLRSPKAQTDLEKIWAAQKAAQEAAEAAETEEERKVKMGISDPSKTWMGQYQWRPQDTVEENRARCAAAKLGKDYSEKAMRDAFAMPNETGRGNEATPDFVITSSTPPRPAPVSPPTSAPIPEEIYEDPFKKVRAQLPIGGEIESSPDSTPPKRAIITKPETEKKEAATKPINTEIDSPEFAEMLETFEVASTIKVTPPVGLGISVETPTPQPTPPAPGMPEQREPEHVVTVRPVQRAAPVPEVVVTPAAPALKPVQSVAPVPKSVTIPQPVQPAPPAPRPSTTPAPKPVDTLKPVQPVQPAPKPLLPVAPVPKVVTTPQPVQPAPSSPKPFEFGASAPKPAPTQVPKSATTRKPAQPSAPVPKPAETPKLFQFPATALKPATAPVPMPVTTPQPVQPASLVLKPFEFGASAPVPKAATTPKPAQPAPAPKPFQFGASTPKPASAPVPKPATTPKPAQFAPAPKPASASVPKPVTQPQTFQPAASIPKLTTPSLTAPQMVFFGPGANIPVAQPSDNLFASLFGSTPASGAGEADVSLAQAAILAEGEKAAEETLNRKKAEAEKAAKLAGENAAKQREAEAATKLADENAAKHKEIEAQREAEAKKQREALARQQREAEAAQKREAEAKRQREAHAKQKQEVEAAQKLKAEPKQQREAEAVSKRKKAAAAKLAEDVAAKQEEMAEDSDTSSLSDGPEPENEAEYNDAKREVEAEAKQQREAAKKAEENARNAAFVPAPVPAHWPAPSPVPETKPAPTFRVALGGNYPDTSDDSDNKPDKKKGEDVPDPKKPASPKEDEDMADAPKDDESMADAPKEPASPKEDDDMADAPESAEAKKDVEASSGVPPHAAPTDPASIGPAPTAPAPAPSQPSEVSAPAPTLYGGETNANTTSGDAMDVKPMQGLENDLSHLGISTEQQQGHQIIEPGPYQQLPTYNQFDPSAVFAPTASFLQQHQQKHQQSQQQPDPSAHAPFNPYAGYAPASSFFGQPQQREQSWVETPAPGLNQGVDNTTQFDPNGQQQGQQQGLGQADDFDADVLKAFAADQSGGDYDPETGENAYDPNAYNPNAYDPNDPLMDLDAKTFSDEQYGIDPEYIINAIGPDGEIQYVRDESPPLGSAPAQEDENQESEEEYEESVFTYTARRPMTPKVQMYDTNRDVINNPDYWHKKKHGQGKIRNMGVYLPHELVWREVDMEALKKYGMYGGGFEEVQQNMPWFDPDATAEQTGGEEPEESNWSEGTSEAESIDTDEASVHNPGKKDEGGEEQDGEKQDGEKQDGEDGGEDEDEEIPKGPYKVKFVVGSNSEQEFEDVPGIKRSEPTPEEPAQPTPEIHDVNVVLKSRQSERERPDEAHYPQRPTSQRTEADAGTLAARKIGNPKSRKGLGVNMPMPQPLPQQPPLGPPEMPVAEHDFVEVGDQQWESAGPPKFHRTQAPAQTQEIPGWKVPEKTLAANQKTQQNALKFVDGKAKNEMGFLPPTCQSPPPSPEPHFTPYELDAMEKFGIKIEIPRQGKTQSEWERATRRRKRQIQADLPKQGENQKILKPKSRVKMGGGLPVSPVGLGPAPAATMPAAAPAPAPVPTTPDSRPESPEPRFTAEMKKFVNDSGIKFEGRTGMSPAENAKEIRRQKREYDANFDAPSIDANNAFNVGAQNTTTSPNLSGQDPAKRVLTPHKRHVLKHPPLLAKSMAIVDHNPIAALKASVAPSSRLKKAPANPPLTLSPSSPVRKRRDDDTLVLPRLQTATRPVAPPMAPLPPRSSYQGYGGIPIPLPLFDPGLHQTLLDNYGVIPDDYDTSASGPGYTAPVVRDGDAPILKQAKTNENVQLPQPAPQAPAPEDVDMDIDDAMGLVRIHEPAVPAFQAPPVGRVNVDFGNVPRTNASPFTFGQTRTWVPRSNNTQAQMPTQPQMPHLTQMATQQQMPTQAQMPTGDHQPMNYADIDMGVTSSPRDGQGNEGDSSSGN